MDNLKPYLHQLVSDEELIEALNGINYGHHNYREILANLVLKIASGFHIGKGSQVLLDRLELKEDDELTYKGKEYLFYSFYKSYDESAYH